VVTDIPASSGGPGKYMKYANFQWLPVEAAQPIFNFIFFFKDIFIRN
jgi:hypothetical protein